MSCKKNKPGQFDRYQRALAKANAMAHPSAVDGVAHYPPPFLTTPLHARTVAEHRRLFNREAVRRELSRYPLPVPPSMQKSANARRSARLSA